MRLLSPCFAAVLLAALAANAPSTAQPATRPGMQRIDLAQQLAAGKLRPVNREVTPLDAVQGVDLTEGMGSGVVWIEGTDFAEGTLEIDIRGRDVMQRSFVGVAFHRKDDKTYEAVYLRPFNFRSQDPVRRDHAVQYIAVPDYDWPRLRKEFPEEFENPVDASVSPTDWVPLRIAVTGTTVQVFVGAATTPTLEVRRLASHTRGEIGLFTGNGSDGAFAKLRVTPAR